MSTPTFKFKYRPVPVIKGKMDVRFPATVVANSFIVLTRNGSTFTLDVDYSVLSPGPVVDPAFAFVAIWDQAAGFYKVVSLASLLTSGLDLDLQAIAALTGAGLLVRIADNTWALRTLTGTANEVTVTNGNGVLGNQTISLPAALTFTGKTVTGGTYTGATITNSTFNGNTWTAGTGILTIAAGKTFTASNTLALTGTDGTSFAFPSTSDTVVTLAFAQTITNKTINASNNTISNLTTSMFAANVVDADSTLAANSTTRLPTQSAVKSYVDNNLTGLSWKAAVAVATTANITLSGEQTIDGVLTSASRVLVKNQTTGSQNGIYVSGAGAWARSSDMDVAAEFPSATVFVAAGTVGGDTQWTCTNNSVVVGTTAVVFAQVSGAGTYSAGTGLQLSGNQFSIDSTVATLAGAQAFTNKTVNGNTFTTGTYTLTGAAGKTFTFSNSLTLAGTDGTVQTFPATSGTVVTSVSVNAVTNAMAAQGGAATKKGNPTAALANVTDYTIQGLTDITTPSATLDWLEIWNHTTGTLQKTNAAELLAAVGSGVSSVGGLAGAVGVGPGIVVSGSNIQTAPSMAGRNRIINGQFAINERAASGGVVDNAYGADRWRMIGEFASATIFADNFNAAGGNVPAGTCQFTGTTDKGGFFQVIEGRDCKDLRSKAVVLSMLLSVSNVRLGNMKVGIAQWAGTEDGTTADPVATWGADGVTPTLATNWSWANTPTNLGVTTSSAPYSVTATLNGTFNNLAVVIWNDDKAYTAGDNFNVTNVQLEEGSVATPYEFIPMSVLKRQCLRYLPWAGGASGDVVGTGDVFGTTIARIGMRWIEPPRVPPTGVTVQNLANFTLISGSTVNNAATGISLSGQGPTGGQLNCTTGVGLTNAAAAYLTASNANARLLFTGCEL